MDFALDRASDPVDVALASGINAIAASMSRAPSGDLIALADRMATLARELEARRLSQSKVVNIFSRRGK